MLHPLGEIVQIANAVNDVTEGARRWAERFGAGPFFVDDIDEAIEGYAALGYQLAGTGNAYGLTRFCYIDTFAERGHLTELYEPSGRLRDFYAMVAEAADGWDGSDPVRLRE